MRVTDFAAAVTVSDVTGGTPARPVAKPAAPRPRGEYALEEGRYLSLEDAGYGAQPPARTYVVTVDERPPERRRPDARLHVGRHRARTGINARSRASATVTASGKPAAAPLLPFYARNFVNVTAVGRAGCTRASLMPTLMRPAARIRGDAGRQPVPSAASAVPRTASSRMASTSQAALGGRPTGLVWAAVREGERRSPSRAPFDGNRACARRSCRSRTSASRSRTARRTRSCSSRGSTRARPWRARTCRSSSTDNTVFWTRNDRPRRRGDCAGDAAARRGQLVEVRVHRDGREGRRRRLRRQRLERGRAPVGFGVPFNLREAEPMLRGTVFSDRGVYRLGRRGARQGDPAAQRAATASGCCPKARRCSRPCATSRIASSTSAPLR